MNASSVFKLIIAGLIGLYPLACISASKVECAEKVSPELAGLLGKKFPTFRLPKLSDLDQESVGYDLQAGGDGCFAVTTGDFDGNGRKDMALVLTPIELGAPKLVVALDKGSSWTLNELRTFCDSIQFCYVKPQKPGTYRRSEALEATKNHPDERLKLTSKTTSVLSGRLESTGVVYVYVKGRWLHVWVSD